MAKKSPAANYDAQFDIIGRIGPPSGYPELSELGHEHDMIPRSIQ
jgi:hypothetical protein